MVATTLTAQADKPFELNLWQGKPKVKSSDPNDTAKVYVYLPNKSQATRRAVVICPGGGYSHLAMDHEGKQVAEWLNQLGIAGIVLKYRMPHGKREVPMHSGISIRTMWVSWVLRLAAIWLLPLPRMPRKERLPISRFFSIL